MLKKYEVIQEYTKDCASSCIQSIMKYYGFTSSKEEINYLIKTDNNGTNAYNILEGIKYLGFNGYGSHYTSEQITSGLISFPIIAHVLIKNVYYHFIVIYKTNVKKQILYVMDPAYGIKKLTFKEFYKIYQNTSLVIYPTKKIENMKNIKPLKDFIFEYLYLHNRTIIKTLILTILTVFLGLISNLYLKLIIDELIFEFSRQMLVIITIIFLLNNTLKSIFDYLRNKSIITINNLISKKMNNDIIRHLLNLPYMFFKTKSTGEVITRVNDLKSFKEIFTMIISNLSLDILLIFISIIVLIIINYKLFIINMFSLILYLIIVILFKGTFKKKIYDLQESESSYNKELIDSIESYEINKNLNLEENIKNKIEIKNILYQNKIKEYESLHNNQQLIKNIICDITLLLSNFIAVILIHNKTITLGEYILFNSILYYFETPLKNIMDNIPNFSYIKNTYERINNLLLVKENESSNTNEKIKGNIKICNLCYSYNNIKESLSNITFEIKYGSKFLIYGSSGNGKSTLIKIILKYIDGYKGDIYINNKNIKDVDRQILANSFTYVSQHNYLVMDTLKNNIVYNRNIKEEDYEKILKITNVDKIRDKFELRNNHLIEDNGFNISGGEKQKILLARFLLKESNYIVLDEALSEVDVEEEIEILNKIFYYFKNKTIIYITHKKEIMKLFKEKYFIERRKRDK